MYNLTFYIENLNKEESNAKVKTSVNISLNNIKNQLEGRNSNLSISIYNNKNPNDYFEPKLSQIKSKVLPTTNITDLWIDQRKSISNSFYITDIEKREKHSSSSS